MVPRIGGLTLRAINRISRSTPAAMSALLTGVVVCILAVPLATAQEHGGFRGKVTDPTGAIVVSADVTATSESTGLGNSTVTNEVGDFELRGLAPGSYTLEAACGEAAIFRAASIWICWAYPTWAAARSCCPTVRAIPASWFGPWDGKPAPLRHPSTWDPPT